MGIDPIAYSWSGEARADHQREKAGYECKLNKDSGKRRAIILSEAMPVDSDLMQAFESYYDQKHDVTVRAPTAMGR
jgi:hypothetical protein